MREIKFRIWSQSNNKFFYSGGTPSMLSGFFKAYAPFNTRDEVPFQQFTGLLDKNGKEIYEGDIVTRPWTDNHGFVHESKSKSKVKEVFWRVSTNQTGWNVAAGKQYIVIGNIYENPELLTKDKS